MDIQEVGARDGLDALRSDWDALLERCEGATVYQTWEWNEAWWRTFGRLKRLRILLVRDARDLVGIAPLYVSGHYNTPLRRLAFLGTGISDYLDVLAPDDRAAQVCSAVLHYLDHGRGFDLADLQQLRPASPLRAAADGFHTLAPSHHPKRRRAALVDMEPCPYVALPGSWDDYAAVLGKKMRSNLGYYDRLLARAYEDAEIRLAGPEDLDAGMSALFALHQSRWNARLLPGVLGTARTQAFHRLAARRFQERGWLRLHLMRAGGRTVSVLYCYRFRDRYYYYLGGFAPDMARFSPGTVLTARAIRAAIEEGCAEFDFLRGHEPYKYRWTSTDRVNARILLSHPRSARSRAMLTINRIERSVEQRAKAFAESRAAGGGLWRRRKPQ